MSSDHITPPAPPLDITTLRKWPVIAIVVGIVGILAGVALTDVADHTQQFAFSWLVGFMFCLSLGIGGFFLTMIHHLVDASWSVPIRRINETLGTILGPTMLVLFLPIALLAKKIYPWMTQVTPDHALSSKHPWFTMQGFYITAIAVFIIWWFFTNRLRANSVKQDENGAAIYTLRMRVLASFGMVFFAVTVTAGAIMWMKALYDEWYSTMYAVTYFAGSVWMTLPTVYLIALILMRTGALKGVVSEKTFYFIGTLFFAFTVFWAYVNFAQYFIIWNANMPEETFFFRNREAGSWKYVGQIVLIFGHFFLPFLMLLRIDWKLKVQVIFTLAVWAWLMHFTDLEFQISPALHKTGILTPGLLSDIGCVLLIAGVIAKVFACSFSRFAPFPQKDPRMAECLEIFVPPHSDISTAPSRVK